MKSYVSDCKWAEVYVRMVFAIVLFALVMLGNAPVYAAPEDDMDIAKAQFQEAIRNGDVQQAKRILYNLNDGIARTVAFSNNNKRFINMGKLEPQSKPEAYEQMALFLSSINAQILYKSDWKSVVPSNAGLSGTVKDDMTSQGLAGVKVIGAGHETTTDANGAFSFTGLPEGTFDLYVFAPGFSSVSMAWIFRADASDKSLNITLHNTMPIKTVIGTETINGTIVDAQSGEPIAGAQFVIAPVKADASFTRKAEADSQGHFTLTGVHAGISELLIQPKNLLYHLPFSQKVNISGGGKTHKVVWKLERTKGGIEIPVGTWVGKVLRSDTEEPIKGARIAIDENWTATDKEGRFTLTLSDTGESIGIEDIQKMSNLNAAEKRDALEKLYASIESGDTRRGDEPYRLKATHNNFSEFSKIYSAKRDRNKEVLIHLNPLKIGDVAGVVVDAVTGRPVGLATIQVQSQSTQSKSDGTFLFKKLHSGDVILQVNAKRYHTAENRIILKPLDKAQVRFELAPITVGKVTGLVLNAVDKTPLIGATITAGIESVITNAKGKFMLSNMAAGVLKVQASKPVFKSSSTGVEVIAAESVNVTLRLEPITVGTVTGVALNAVNEKPLAGVKVNMGAKTATTDAEGHFKLVGINAGNTMVEGSKAVFESVSKNVTVQPAKTVNVTLKLEPITVGDITGVALNAADHTPLTGVKISIGTKSAMTDQQGHFKLSDIDVGDVTVDGSKAVFKSVSQGVKVLAAKSVDVTLKLAPITVGEVTGVALNGADQKPLSDVTVAVGTKTATTDAHGRFKLAGIDAGNVTVEGSKAVFKPALKDVKVLAAKNVTVTLKLAPITVGDVTGVVLNAADQKPLSGVTVTVGTTTAMTDTQGRFKLMGIDAGDVTVGGSKAVFEPASQGIKVEPAKSVAVTLKLSPITVGEVTGIALNAVDQKPLAGVKVNVGAKTATTDAEGHFKLVGINAGNTMVEGSKAVFKPASQGVKVLAAKSVDVTLKLMAITTASIRGIVVDKKNKKPIKGVRVSTGNKTDETDAAGRFTLKNIDVGKIVLISRHIEYKTDEQKVKLKAGYTYDKTVEMERRREDVVALERALKEKGTVDLYGIHFDSGKDQFLPSSLPTLQAVSAVIKADKKGVFEVSGHTDSDGQENYNQNLSERRAKTVIRWLINHGVRADQLKGKGYGETKPVVPNSTEASKALNRRVQLRVINR